MMKSKKWIYVSILIAILVVALLLFPFDEVFPIANNSTNTTTAVTTTSTTTTATTTTVKETTSATEKTAETFLTTAKTNATSTDTKTTTITTKITPTKATTHSKPSSSKKTTSTHSSVDLSGMEYINGEYFDRSNLTFSQADVGKVVGYSPGMNRDIIVCSVDETPTVDGRRAVCLLLGYRGIEGHYYVPSEFCIVECEYCHEMPCPHDGGEQCPQYDVKLDGHKTCQQCGRPNGDGYNGTCYGTIDWDNGGIRICHHYD